MSGNETFGSAHEDNEEWKRFRESGILRAHDGQRFFPDQGTDIPGDGDCFYHCVARARPELGTALDIRQKITEYCLKEGALVFKKVVRLLTDSSSSEESTLKDIRTPGRWGGNVVAVLCYGCFNIRMFFYNVIREKLCYTDNNKRGFEAVMRMKQKDLEDEDDEDETDVIHILHHHYGRPFSNAIANHFCVVNPESESEYDSESKSKSDSESSELDAESSELDAESSELDDEIEEAEVKRENEENEEAESRIDDSASHDSTSVSEDESLYDDFKEKDKKGKNSIKEKVNDLLSKVKKITSVNSPAKEVEKENEELSNSSSEQPVDNDRENVDTVDSDRKTVDRECELVSEAEFLGKRKIGDLTSEEYRKLKSIRTLHFLFGKVFPKEDLEKKLTFLEQALSLTGDAGVDPEVLRVVDSMVKTLDFHFGEKKEKVQMTLNMTSSPVASCFQNHNNSWRRRSLFIFEHLFFKRPRSIVAKKNNLSKRTLDNWFKKPEMVAR